MGRFNDYTITELNILLMNIADKHISIKDDISIKLKNITDIETEINKKVEELDRLEKLYQEISEEYMNKNTIDNNGR